MTPQETKAQVKQLQEQIAVKLNDLQQVFKDGLKELLLENKQLSQITMYCSNYEFNDGEPEYYSLNYEDLVLHFIDDLGEETDYDGYPDKEDKEKSELRKKFINFFHDFDVDAFYEKLFPDNSETMYFSVKNNKLVIE